MIHPGTDHHDDYVALDEDTSYSVQVLAKNDAEGASDWSRPWSRDEDQQGHERSA